MISTRLVTRYIAFLRGINVGGRRLIKMSALAEILESAGFKNVRTYIASGNVIFDSASENKITLTRKIEKTLKGALGYEVTIVLRTLAEVASLVGGDRFKNRPQGKDVMQFVVLLAEEPKNQTKIPMVSPTENFEVFEVSHGAAFILARRKKTGWFGFPNNFIEKHFAVAATTRNWSTLQKIVKVAEK